MTRKIVVKGHQVPEAEYFNEEGSSWHEPIKCKHGHDITMYEYHKSKCHFEDGEWIGDDMIPTGKVEYICEKCESVYEAFQVLEFKTI